ncbi:hypothetical protein CMUST_01250 [Corynebacterium mustelae]|uniref:Uncharacterized protein n=1 Tax=Corynebacterium mustelae TaxID=571915 RepID=A0A0G3GTY2_9CORY|nr:transglycosylase SLT domain-containing protein [Corynebacterium mustelae]AKK04599.1 hypothetical protein CMUST_01250 [Corynebacterium mustelae]
MAEYSAGSAKITISPNLAGFAKKAKAALEKMQLNVSADVEPDADGFRARLKEELGVVPDVEVGVDADTSVATAKIDAAAQSRTATINADADVAAAEQRLDRIARDRVSKIRPDVDRSGIRQATAAFREMGSSAATTAGSVARISGLGIGVGTIGVAAAGAIAPLAAMASAAASAAGTLLTLPAAAAAASAGIAAVAIGVSGIGGAFSAMGKSATGGAADTSKAVKSAASQVAAAERRVADSQKAAKKAQENLNEARREATRELKEMNQQLRDAALDEEEAVLAVARAKQQLQETNKDSKSSELDRAEADLAYRQAVARLESTREKNNQLARDVQAANDAGVEGAKRVVEAKERVEDAVQAEADAQRNLAEAMERLADAASTSASGGVDQFAEALSNLSPNARAFVLAIQALGDQWRDLRFAVQDNLFAGLDESVTHLANVQLPILKQGLAGIATEINGGWRAAMSALASESSQVGMEQILSNSAGLFRELNTAAVPFTQGMMDLAAAGSSYLPQLGEHLGSAGQRLGKFLSTAASDGTFDRWITNGVEALKGIGQTISDVSGIVSGVFSAAAAAGESSLSPLGTVLGHLNQFVNSVEGQTALQGFFSSMTEGLNALAPIMGTVLTTVGSTIMPALSEFIQAAAPGVGAFVDSLAQGFTALAPAMGPLGEAFGAIAQSLVPVVETLAPVIAQIAQGLAPAISGLAPAIGPAVLAFAGFAKVKGFISPLISLFGDAGGDEGSGGKGLGGVLKKVGGIVSKVSKVFGVLSKGLVFFTGPVGLVVAAVAALTAGLVYAYKNSETFRNAVNKVGNFLKTAFKAAIQIAISVIKSIIGKVIEAKNKFDHFKKAAEVMAHIVAQKIKDVWENIKSLPGKIGEVFRNAGTWLKDAGRNIINGLWSGIQEKWESVKSWFSNSMGSFLSSIGTGSANANGSVSFFASGGVRGREVHDPMIVPAGDVRIFGERETGGEAYIPLANDSRRPRAEGILGAVANHFGLAVVDQKTGAPFTPSYKKSLAPKSTTFFAEGGVTIHELDDFAKGLEGKPYVWGGVKWGDCSGAQSALARFSVGLDPWAGRFATGNQASALRSLGFTAGKGKPGDFNIAWFNGGPYGGHTSSTLPTGVNTEMGGARGNGQYGGRAAGWNHPQYNEFAHLPRAFFRQVEVPKIGELGSLGNLSDVADLDLSDVTTESAQPLKALRSSTKSDPDSYSTESESGPSSWSEIAGNFAKTFVEGQVKDLAGTFGIADEFPPLMKALTAYSKATSRAQESTGQLADKRLDEIASASNTIQKLAPGVPVATVTGAQVLAKKPVDTMPKRVPGEIGHVYDPKQGAEQWRGMAMEAMRRTGFDARNSAQVNAMIAQIKTESGGNPRIAQQIVDVNGTGEKAGVGLLQIIPGTFAAHRDPELPNDRKHPFANMVAALRYYRSRYGGDLTTHWGKGRGYANGGSVWGPGGPTDDLIPIMASNGEIVIREAAASVARPLLERVNSDPSYARYLQQETVGGRITDTSHSGKNIEVHYHIETNNLDDGLRRAEMHARREVIGMMGV